MAKYMSQTSENLFNPNMVYTGDVSSVLDGYPSRSKNLRKKEVIDTVDPKFVKDGYAYLLRGAKKGQESGFYSREYARRQTIESLGLDVNHLHMAHKMTGDTPFISTTTDYYIAASFSKKERIYVVKVPVEDVYVFPSEIDDEHECLIPDFIGKDDIVGSFRYNKAGAIYRFLVDEIGLDLGLEDLGMCEEDLTCINFEKLQRYIDFNGEDEVSPLDDIISSIKGAYLNSAYGNQKIKK